MNSAPILPARLDWPSAIGNFILQFGMLDYYVFCFLKDKLSPDEFIKVKEWHLKDRINKIKQHLLAAHYSTEKQDAFARLVERLEPIRKLRNHIVHGHLYASFDPETKNPKVILFKVKDLDTGLLPVSKHLEFNELMAELSKLNELVEEFGNFVGFKTSATLDFQL